MKLKCSFEFVEVGDETVAVPEGENAKSVNGVLKLNKEGLEIFSMLEKETSEAEIVDTLAGKYKNSRESLAAYVRNLLETLRSNGLITE